MAMSRYDEAYFENLANRANIMYKYLYYNSLSDEMKRTIIDYLDTYFSYYKKYTNMNVRDENLSRIFSILEGPINEANNQYNLSLNDGKPHPAVDIIKQKLSEFFMQMDSENISAANSLDKGKSRILNPPGISGIKLFNDESGFAKSFIIILATILIGIIIAVLTIKLK